MSISYGKFLDLISRTSNNVQLLRQPLIFKKPMTLPSSSLTARANQPSLGKIPADNRTNQTIINGAGTVIPGEIPPLEKFKNAPKDYPSPSRVLTHCERWDVVQTPNLLPQAGKPGIRTVCNCLRKKTPSQICDKLSEKPTTNSCDYKKLKVKF